MHRKQVFELLRQLSIILGKDVTPERLKLYCEYLEKYPFEKIKVAINRLVKTTTFFPSLSEIINLIELKADEKDHANELAGEIIQCISDLGSHRFCDLEKRVGEVGVFAVERFGGWSMLCKTDEKQLPTVRAQLRDVCKMAISVHAQNPDSLKLNYAERKADNKLESIKFELLS